MTCGYGKEAMWNGGVMPECIWTPEFILFFAVLLTFIALAIYDRREVWRYRRSVAVILVGAAYTVFNPLLGLGASLVTWFLFR